MKKIYLLLFALIFSASIKAQQTIAICNEKQGCEIAKTNLSRIEIDKLLGKQKFLTVAPKNAILVINDCKSTIEVKKTTVQIHQSFGGKGTPKTLTAFNLKEYLTKKGCISNCSNTTKKISFKLTSDEFNSSGYFFANIKGGEAFMPNAAYQQFYAGQDMAAMKVDAFFRDFKHISYTIDPEGGKFVTDMPIATSIAKIGNDVKNEARFKKDFKPTGKKRPHLATKDFQFEYVGKDNEGAAVTFWLGPAYDICLPPGKFDAIMFWNLGYMAFNGKTYLIAEISGSGFKVTVTNVTEGSYSFNPVGYEAYGTQ